MNAYAQTDAAPDPAFELHPTLAKIAAGTTDTICIAWVDVSCLTRECMTHAVAAAQRLFIIIPFETVYDCIRHSGRKIDLIVYHSHETDSVNVADVVALREAFSATQVVVLSDASALPPALVREVLMKGASGFILADRTSMQMMLSALSLVASGGTFIPKEFFLVGQPTEEPQEQRQPSKPGQLTHREVEVLGLVKQGKPNKIIAYELSMSASTAKVHVRNVMRKMGATNRTQVAMNADRHLGSRAAF